MPTIEERVAKGAALMDEKVPGWHERIDTVRLAMASCVDCILGQTISTGGSSTHYMDAAESLGLDPHSNEDADHGFQAYPLGVLGMLVSSRESLALRTAWLAEIARRLQPTEATS